MSGLPEWKTQLLERKRKEEEEQRRRDEEQRDRLSKMPTWKREIIERRRAKMGSSEMPFSEPAGSWDGPQSHGSAFCNQTANNFHSSSAEPTESLVLQEKIGPVHQNRFIKLEKQRKESFEGDAASRMRQMTDLYTHMPGVRTIRAENIIIIESDPQIFQLNSTPLKENAKCKSVEALNEAVTIRGGRTMPEIHAADVLAIKSSFSRSVEDLNSFKGQEDLRVKGHPHRGTVSKLLSKFGQEKSGWIRPVRSLSTENIVDKEAPPDSFKEPFRAGPRAQCSSPGSPHSGDPFSFQEDGITNECRPTIVVRPLNLSKAQSLGISRATPSLDGERGQGDFEHILGAVQSQFKAQEPMPLLESPRKSTNLSTLWPMEPSRHHEAVEESHQEQEPTQGKTTDTRGSSAPSLKQTMFASTCPSDSFEIRPAPPPDFSLLAEDDLQGKALANLRLQSKSSFVIIPRRQPAPPPPLQPSLSHGEEASCLCKPSAGCCHSPSSSCLTAAPAAAVSCTEDRQQPVENALGASWEGARPLNSWALSASDLVERPEETGSPSCQSLQDSADMSRLYSLKPALVPRKMPPLVPEEGRPTPFNVRTASAVFGRAERPMEPLLPPDQGLQSTKDMSKTRIGNVVSVGRGPSFIESPAVPSSPELAGKAAHPAMQRRSGNTITVNPRKGPPAATRPSPTTAENGCLEIDTTVRADTSKAIPVKKRYPTAEEIQVLGGYLSLEKSCLAKNDPNRKKLKITFSERRLESTYEYPSESSLLEQYGPPEEAEAPAQVQGEEDEEEEEEALLLQHGISGSPSVGDIMRTKPLIVDESCRR
ncbi:phostensin [Rhinatrema bivittatum]|uniref:phostensin n=1 Tax=Rhinatrema bivittatum TaxID=194408 RepID=UPI00112CC854|nr:phostensin [Rhinatrema bivittatum]